MLANRPLIRNLRAALREIADPENAPLIQALSAIDPAWIAAAERRYQEVKSGHVQAVPGDGLFDQIRQELGWRT